MHILSALVTVIAVSQAPGVPEYWGSLRPGSHAVGFRQRWVIDSTRRIPTRESRGLVYRPILMNLWYPAEGAVAPAMPYREYFTGPLRGLALDTPLGRYASALTTFVRDLSVREMVRSSLDSAPAPLRQRLDAFLNSPTAVQRNAPMKTGRRPVVIYLQGSRASYDDNAALCEYLASRGYLVIGSAFPKENDADFMTSASDESRQRDVRRLLVEVSRMPNVEPGLVTVVGHSAGAQAMLLFTADPTAPIDAVLALDTTQDYALLTDRTWAYMTDKVIDERKAIRTPIVFFASPRALFELADSLSATRRWLATVPDLEHNDFIMQGVVRRELSGAVPNRDSRAVARTREAYDAVVRYIGAWLDAFVASAALATIPAPPAPLTVEFIPPGTSSPIADRSRPPSARLLRHLFTTSQRAEFTDAFLAARRAGDPAGGTDVLMMLLTGAIAGEHHQLARSTLRQLGARDPAVRRSVLDLIADRKRVFEQYSLHDLAQVWQGYLMALEPASTGVRKRN